MSKSLPASTSTEADATAPTAPTPQTWWRTASARLLLASGASVLVHAVLTGWPLALGPYPPEPPTLAVRLAQMPPPPVPQVQPPTQPPRRVLTRRAAPRATPAPVIAETIPQVVADNAQFSPPPPAPAEPVPAPTPPPPGPPPHALPPARFELVYTVSYGDQGFMVGASRYRFHHADGRYELEHITRAQGITRLVYRGAFRMVSRGSIASAGLRPDELVVERGGPERRETARFDWATPAVTVRDNTILPLAPPTYDVLSLLLQFYFVPPQSEQLHFQVVSTRKLYDFVFERMGDETVTTAMGAIPTQHWKRRAAPGDMETELWLSPDFNYIPVKIRLSGSDRSTAEEILDGIFADPPDEADKTMP